MNSQLFDFIKELEKKPANILFRCKNVYNYGVKLRENDKKLFLMVCKNYLRDSVGVNDRKILTIKYWFLHNLLFVMESYNVNSDGIREIMILRDYVEMGVGVEKEEIFYLPDMKRFGVWCNLRNNEKNKLHCRLIKEMMYLDDNYFFIINYLKNHEKKFLERLCRRVIDDKNNNFMMHFIRSANSKNNEIAYRNFVKIFNYLENMIYGDTFIKNLKEKNCKGMRPIHYVSYLKKKFYCFVVNSLCKNKSLRSFMETVFWQLMRNVRHFFQFEYVMVKIIEMDSNEEIGFVEKIVPYKKKFEQLYLKLLVNKSIPFYDKVNIIENMLDYGLIKIEEEHRSMMGRRLWGRLNSNKENIIDNNG